MYRLQNVIGFCVVLVVLVMTSVANVATAESDRPEEAFEKMMSIAPISTNVPAIVEVPLPERVQSGERFLIRENETGRYLGSYVKQTVTLLTKFSITANQPGDTSKMSDGRLDTYTSFPVPSEGVGMVVLGVYATEPITTNELLLRLDKNVALPTTVELRYRDSQSGMVETILAKRGLSGTSIYFPEVSSDYFEVTFTYTQPLRIAEALFVEHIPATEQEQSVRFLAQPGYSYDVYYGADRFVPVAEAETGDLVGDTGMIVKVEAPALARNPAYRPADVDGDGVRDIADNCVTEENVDQADIDANGRGDVCDDWDRDGHQNNHDNCVNEPNRDQRDTDLDEIGDVCDTEESRFTEKNPWVPWVGIGMAVLVLLVLFALVARQPRGGQEVAE